MSKRVPIIHAPRPSWRFRLWQAYCLPWRIVCAFKGHVPYKWACLRCFKVDEVALAFYHVDNTMKREYKKFKHWWWR